MIISNQCQYIRQTAAVLLACGLIVGLLPSFAAAQDQSAQAARTAGAGAIVPLDGPVLVGEPVTFKLSGNPANPHWDLGDGAAEEGASVTYTYQKPGIYRVVMGSKAGDTFNELSSAIVRVHTPETVHLPQVLLDTDARNEVDDQHYIAYGLFSNLDVLGINSAHHGSHRINHFGAAQEPINYGEILYIIELSRISGLLEHRTENQIPRAFRSAKVPLEVPANRQQLELTALRELNAEHLATRDNDFQLLARLQTFETAFGMQMAVPDVFDFTKETESTLAIYGLKRDQKTGFGWQCLAVRRLVERGVRFVELIERLTYRHAGLDFRLTGVEHAHVVKGVLA